MHRQNEMFPRPKQAKGNKADAAQMTMVHPDGVITASAPGKCILFGEHAVVYGEPAVAVALEQRMHLKLIPSTSWSLNGAELDEEKHPHVWSLLGEFGGIPAVPPMDILITGDIPRSSGKPYLEFAGTQHQLQTLMVMGSMTKTTFAMTHLQVLSFKQTVVQMETVMDLTPFTKRIVARTRTMQTPYPLITTTMEHVTCLTPMLMEMGS